MSLFRPEALKHRQDDWLGEVQLARPVGLRLLTLGAVLALLAVLAVLFLGESSRRVRLMGVLQPDLGLVRVTSGQAGRVESVALRQGAAIHAGDLLFTLSADLPQLEGPAQAALQATFDQRLRSLDASAERIHILSAQQAQALDRRAEGLRGEAAQLDAQAKWQAQRLALAEQALARLESLERDQFVSAAQVQAKNEEVLGLRVEAAGLTRQRQSLAREQQDIAAQLRDLPLQSAQQAATLARDRSEVAELAARSDPQASRRTWALKAPADGQIMALEVARGQTVGPDATLATLIPVGATLQAHLYAPSSALGFLRSGQSVQLRLQAFPYQKYGGLAGQVLQVAQAPMPAAELGGALLAPSALGGEPFYRVLVALPQQAWRVGGRPVPLLAGMQLEADVMLERRRLIEWMLAPLWGWRQR